MGSLFTININLTADLGIVNQKLDTIIKLQKDMAKDFAKLETEIHALNEKSDRLQSTLDAEQEQIQLALGKLADANAAQTELIAQLREELAGLGADQAKIDELATLAEGANAKVEAAITDLGGTIADEEGS